MDEYDSCDSEFVDVIQFIIDMVEFNEALIDANQHKSSYFMHKEPHIDSHTIPERVIKHMKFLNNSRTNLADQDS